MPPLRVNSQDLCVCSAAVVVVGARSRLQRREHVDVKPAGFGFLAFKHCCGFSQKEKEKVMDCFTTSHLWTLHFLCMHWKKTVLWKQNQNFSSVLPRSGSVSRTFSATQTGKTCVLFRRAKPIISTLDLGVPDEIHPSSLSSDTQVQSHSPIVSPAPPRHVPGNSG